MEKGFICPSCKARLEIGIKCTCSNPVSYDVLGYVKGKLQCIGYTDSKGNIWRFSKERI